MSTQTKTLTWLGWLIAVLIGLMFIGGGVMVLFKPDSATEMMVGKFGYPEKMIFVIGILEIICGAVYLFPPTAVLGAVLLTGYLGGAVATHVRVHDNFAMAAIVGVLVWISLYLRDPRIRALLPFRRRMTPADSN